MDKETLRKAVIKERLELTNQEILTRSRIICQKIINTPEYKTAKVVYIDRKSTRLNSSHTS